MGISPWQIHDMSFAEDGTIFAGENDNPYRSSYLWEIHPENNVKNSIQY